FLKEEEYPPETKELKAESSKATSVREIKENKLNSGNNPKKEKRTQTVTPEEKLEIKRAQNKERAKRARAKRKNDIIELIEEYKKIKEENDRLKEENEKLNHFIMHCLCQNCQSLFYNLYSNKKEEIKHSGEKPKEDSHCTEIVPISGPIEEKEETHKKPFLIQRNFPNFPERTKKPNLGGLFLITIIICLFKLGTDLQKNYLSPILQDKYIRKLAQDQKFNYYNESFSPQNITQMDENFFKLRNYFENKITPINITNLSICNKKNKGNDTEDNCDDSYILFYYSLNQSHEVEINNYFYQSDDYFIREKLNKKLGKIKDTGIKYSILRVVEGYNMFTQLDICSLIKGINCLVVDKKTINKYKKF
ncbi:MAG: hypothetical protein MJ252_08900, partial [archaeon]|nr:hypothetical protein [archaeon]